MAAGAKGAEKWRSLDENDKTMRDKRQLGQRSALLRRSITIDRANIDLVLSQSQILIGSLDCCLSA